jgi:Phospholipase_D-nuclease N-terminal
MGAVGSRPTWRRLRTPLVPGLASAALVVWIFVWLLVAVRVVRRRDLGFGGKLLWLVVILVVPFIGLFVYFLWDASRPGRA